MVPPDYEAPLNDEPMPPAQAYYGLAEALEELDATVTAGEHTCCMSLPHEVPLAFIDPFDGFLSIAFTRTPVCLILAMDRQGCCYAGVARIPGRTWVCPDTIERMPW